MMDNCIYDAKTKIDPTYLPLLRARHIRRYELDWDNDWIKYGKNLAAPRSIDIFQGNKILVRRILSGENIDGIFINETYINNTDVINIIPKADVGLILLKAFSAIILSSVCAKYLKSKNINLDREAFPKINVNTLETFPIPELSEESTNTLAQKADIMLIKNKELQELKNKFLQLLQSELGIKKPSTKMEQWHILDWAGFGKELEKAKVKLSLPQKAEWMAYFNTQKEKAQAIQAFITQTDKEIDGMVYRLYELTEEEIAIVEGK